MDTILTMKLYVVPRNTRIKIVGEFTGEEFLFHHIDGMYSYCTTQSGDVVHISASTDVEIVDKHVTI